MKTAITDLILFVVVPWGLGSLILGDAYGPGFRPSGPAPSGLSGFAASIPIAGEVSNG